MIKRSKKLCIECGVPSYMWSKGRCQRCASKSYAKLKPISEKGKVKKQAKKEMFKSDLEFYMSIWNSRVHTCYECTKDLGNEPNLCYFHHVLRKSTYPDLRHNAKNILILCKECHNQVETNISFTPLVKEYTIDLLKQYLQFNGTVL